MKTCSRVESEGDEGIESFFPLIRSLEVVGLMEKWEDRVERKSERGVEGGKERGRD